MVSPSQSAAPTDSDEQGAVRIGSVPVSFREVAARQQVLPRNTLDE